MTGAELLTERHRLNLTQNQLCSALGISRATLIRWEHRKGKIPVIACLAVWWLGRNAVASGAKKR